MKRKYNALNSYLKRGIFIIFFFCLPWLVSLSNPSYGQQQNYSVNQIFGQITIKRQNKIIHASANNSLLLNDTILSSNSSDAVITLPDRSNLKLGENTSVTLGVNKFILNEGKLVLKSTINPYSIQTSNCLVSLKEGGIVFMRTFIKQNSNIALILGDAIVKGKFGALVLVPGNAITITPGGNPLTNPEFKDILNQEKLLAFAVNNSINNQGLNNFNINKQEMEQLINENNLLRKQIMEIALEKEKLLKQATSIAEKDAGLKIVQNQVITPLQEKASKQSNQIKQLQQENDLLKKQLKNAQERPTPSPTTLYTLPPSSIIKNNPSYTAPKQTNNPENTLIFNFVQNNPPKKEEIISSIIPKPEKIKIKNTDTGKAFVCGITLDARSDEPLPFVIITDKTGVQIGSTDDKGSFFLPYNPNQDIELIFKKNGYYDLPTSVHTLVKTNSNPKLYSLVSPPNIQIFLNNSLSLNYYVTTIDERFVPEKNVRFTGWAYNGINLDFNVNLAPNWLLKAHANRINYELSRVDTGGEKFNRLEQLIDLSVNYNLVIFQDKLELLFRQGFRIQQFNREKKPDKVNDFLDTDQFRQNIYLGISAGTKFLDSGIASIDLNISPLGSISTSDKSFPSGLLLLEGVFNVRYRIWQNLGIYGKYTHNTWLDSVKQFAQQNNAVGMGLRYEW